MEAVVKEFIDYIQDTKHSSENTIISYQHDLYKMIEWFSLQNFTAFHQITESLLQEYLQYLEEQHFAASTISRNLASIRAFFQYLFEERIINADPTENLHSPKVEKKLPDILSVSEIDRLLKQPDIHTTKGIRDKAMLELLYATGMRVSELIHLKLTDVNLALNYVTCTEKGRERRIPIGSVCKKALHRYLEKGRKALIQDTETPFFFTNCSGKAMSRQGFWKILKRYAKAAGIQTDITPHTLRHSFAVHMLQNGADLKSMQEILGHADISTTQLYTNMELRKMQDVYTKAHPRK